MKHHIGCVCVVEQSSAGAVDCCTMLRFKIELNLAKGSLTDTFSLLHVQHRCLCFFAQKPSPDVSFPRTKLTLTKEWTGLELRLLGASFGWRGLGRKIKGFSVLSASVSERREQFVTVTSKPSALQRSKTKECLMTKMVIAVVKNKASNYAFITFMYTLRLSQRN